MQQLREILDVVEIVMGFLSSGGANAKKSLKDYIKTTLKMEHKFSSKKASLISFLHKHTIIVSSVCIWCIFGSLEDIAFKTLVVCQ